ncbi:MULTISPECIES: TIGR03826 family flagellar region protein [unclassified Bacillus (in: firmicutes)]|uniref:TIGR03826 family flagellar region protein n=1 Tax=unclassified Bacillus (in: firmicutes) TaxID=185979 RepID=UPI0008F0DDE7|nr:MULTISPECIES: TIGR03826 family flagellar region protein [unclassified Bacillus (in: firmicutes)]SFB25333.1 flagellar operon protein TIGR03826 [Bacillus sp. UNCCL13]SFQ91709.1 flagellar operon protein TIGR03826 [Bacillus sp. cl95]
MDLQNCPHCNEIFVKTQFRELCQKCWKAEEDQYDIVQKFLRKRENRAATMMQVEEQTGVPEATVLKFIRSGRLHITSFPNLGYPCDQCGSLIRTGKLCDKCAKELLDELKTFENEEERKRQLHKKSTYYSSK